MERYEGLPEPIVRLAQHFGALPSIGPKSAQRLAIFCLGMPEQQVADFARALVDAKANVRFCTRCGMYAQDELCPICADSRRDQGLVCVVRDPRDVLAMERSREYKGVYHVLHGVISPMAGVGPDDIHIPQLVARVGSGQVREVILATNPDVEGDVTAMVIAGLIKPLGASVTRIAHGVPVGANLEYTDEVTLQKAMEGRREMG